MAAEIFQPIHSPTSRSLAGTTLGFHHGFLARGLLALALDPTALAERSKMGDETWESIRANILGGNTRREGGNTRREAKRAGLMRLWVTTKPEITALVNANIETHFGTACRGIDIMDEQPTVYMDSVVLFFAETIPLDVCRTISQISTQEPNGARRERVHNVIAATGPTCDQSFFYSSAGQQDLDAHPHLKQLMMREMTSMIREGVHLSSLQ